MDKMEKKLRQMFDYQRFSGNAELDKMLADAEARNPAVLSDEDLDLVAGGRIRYGDRDEKESPSQPTDQVIRK